MTFNEDRYRDAQLNKYLSAQELGRDEEERLELERGRKAQVLAEEFQEEIDSLNKEYRDLEPITAKDITDEHL